MSRPRKPLDEVDWELASQHLVLAFPGAGLPEVIARAEAAAVALDHRGLAREAEAMCRAAQHIRRKMLN